MCEIPGSKDSSKIGYIKLTTFNQNAAGLPLCESYNVIVKHHDVFQMLSRAEVLIMSIHYRPTESVKEAIKTLRDNNVKSFVLDLRNNRFGTAEIGIYVDV